MKTVQRYCKGVWQLSITQEHKGGLVLLGALSGSRIKFRQSEIYGVCEGKACTLLDLGLSTCSINTNVRILFMLSAARQLVPAQMGESADQMPVC